MQTLVLDGEAMSGRLRLAEQEHGALTKQLAEVLGEVDGAQARLTRMEEDGGGPLVVEYRP